ncbi:MAG: DNA-binding protein [Candidatus Bathyarchaeota archaeon BA1]|nr:MAG: DNA-binding protein [Candidatus Bathyarchaeota archaeon BA1]
MRSIRGGQVSEEDEEMEELRRRRLLELQQRLAQEQQRIQVQQQIEMQKQAILRRILTPEARQRITNLKMVRPEFAAQLELQLIQLAQQGRLNTPVTDEQLREILARLQSRRREIRIRRV